MGKYIDAEKLIAKIEKRQEERQDMRDSASWENEYWPESEFSTRDDEDDAILSIITSLQQEQPEVDLEKEIEEQINMYLNGCEKKLNQMSDDDTEIGFLTLNSFARHFAEWGATHLNARK